MPTVYEADHLIDAHLARGRLLAEGIEATVQGESLAGGIGELPPAGLIRVCVDERDLAQARQAIQEWLDDLARDDPFDDSVGVLL